MIHISQVLTLVEKHLKCLQPKEAVHFKTYKRDRGFLLYCLGDTQFQIIEAGYHNHTFTGDVASTRKHVKKVLKREFPRSNKVWVEYYQAVDDPSNVNSSHTPQMPLF
ncbi:conserved hypothetical protein [Vibrio coralliirubri]|uniref:hypothetical protein n=1 Tax=Vibrio TaxID=662 RepID=UPI000631701C|nr:MULTISPECIES: hypothetical protein [Vibrio]UPR30118.1 hypothetical protein IS519_02210 [Vibrio crassostreae]CDT88626.1 conserved hypothetical protein [Vibrio coralliirubri]